MTTILLIVLLIILLGGEEATTPMDGSDKSDPRIRVLRVRSESAEFWEGAGTVATAVKLVAAIAQASG